MPKASLCFSCIRSAAPPSLQCIWDASKATILPEGAVAETHILSERIPVKKILSCPLYLSMDDQENMDMLLKARGRNREQVEKEKILNERCAILDDDDFDRDKE